MKRKIAMMLIVGTILAVALPHALEAQGVMFVKNNRVSIGTDTPTSTLDIFSSDGSARLKVRDNKTGSPAFRTLLQLQTATGVDPKLLFLSGTGGTWELSPAGAGAVFAINEVIDPGTEMLVFKNGNVTIEGNLTQGSSRTIKKEITAVDPAAALARVVELPIMEWSYIEGAPERHVGPMAEDFFESFMLGPDDAHVAPADTAGVALAAIQGLYELVGEKDARIARLESELAALKDQLAAQR